MERLPGDTDDLASNRQVNVRVPEAPRAGGLGECSSVAFRRRVKPNQRPKHISPSGVSLKFVRWLLDSKTLAERMTLSRRVPRVQHRETCQKDHWSLRLYIPVSQIILRIEESTRRYRSFGRRHSAEKRHEPSQDATPRLPLGPKTS